MWYLCAFYHRLLDYRKAEVESLAELFGARGDDRSLEWRLPEQHHPDTPFHFVNLPSEAAARDIANRSTPHNTPAVCFPLKRFAGNLLAW
jgi:tRNA (guanine10-N2)-methyltransferase